MTWKSQTIFVDQATGEIIKPYLVQNGEYVVIHQTKSVTRTETGGTVIYYKYCSRNQQLRLKLIPETIIIKHR